jgi:CBS-domain-containing membrane protein
VDSRDWSRRSHENEAAGASVSSVPTPSALARFLEEGEKARFEMDHIRPTGSVMRPFPSTVPVDDLTARAVMVEHEIRHLPVKDGSSLVGILTDRNPKRALDPHLGLPSARETAHRMRKIPQSKTECGDSRERVTP